MRRKLVAAHMPVNGTDAVVAVLFEDGKAVEISVEGREEKLRTGDIYVGHVETVSDAAGGAFVLIRGRDKGFLPANRVRNACFCTPKKDAVIKPGDELLVQVETDAQPNKHTVLKTNLKIPGGKKALEELREKGVHRPWGTCLYHAPAPWSEWVGRYGKESFDRILTDVDFVREDLCREADLYDDPLLALYKLYDLTTVLDRSTAKKVWLPGGGHIVIERTEAFVSIDVNSAKAGKSRNLPTEDYLLNVNLEAAAEAARQIRCRQLSGTILIDFISMKTEKAKEKLIRTCRELAAADPVYTTVVDLTALGIMEITRHKVKQSLAQQIRSL